MTNWLKIMTRCPRSLRQGLTAQLKRFLWDRRSIQRLFRGYQEVIGGSRGGGSGVFCVRNGSG
jgi:hypothetical protein